MELEGSWLLSAVLGLLYQGLSKQTAQKYKIGGKYPANLLPFLPGCSKVVKMNWKIKQKRYQRHPRRKKAAAGDEETPHTLFWNCTNSQKSIKIILGHLLFSCVSSLPDLPWMLRAKAAVGTPCHSPRAHQPSTILLRELYHFLLETKNRPRKEAEKEPSWVWGAAMTLETAGSKPKPWERRNENLKPSKCINQGGLGLLVLWAVGTPPLALQSDWIWSGAMRYSIYSKCT